jgi:hypothetical protein
MIRGLVTAPLILAVVVCHPAVVTPQNAGVITGVVVNERQQPVARALVQVFAAGPSAVPEPQPAVPFSGRAAGSASADAAGQFRIEGLAPGDYLVAAHATSSVLQRTTPAAAAIYATTFHPSATDSRAAVPVTAGSSESPIRVQLVRVDGVRISGSVVSQSGRPTTGMQVSLFHQFGGHGSQAAVAVVNEAGAFEASGVAPGWYRLTIGWPSPVTISFPPATAESGRGDSATRLIEVRDSDIEGLVFALVPEATIVGRVVAEPGSGIRPVGLRISASLADDYSMTSLVNATVAPDWSFRMSGLNGTYTIGVHSGREFVAATGFMLDGSNVAVDTAIELRDGRRELIISIAPREAPRPFDAGLSSLSSAALVERFRADEVSYRQFAVAQEIATRGDSRPLAALEPWLTHEDRHQRANAAFVFARFGDPRGLQVLEEILSDRSNRPEGQVIRNGRFSLELQISADRYYAVHVLGELRDAAALPLLVPLLQDEEVDYKVASVLGLIGDPSAIPPLIAALDDENPTLLVHVIYALETLNAKEALPRLAALLKDQRLGAGVSVAEAAEGAIAALK